MMANTLDGKKKRKKRERERLPSYFYETYGKQVDRERRRNRDLWKETIRFKRRPDKIYDG